jgi:hypothetical protein
MDIRVTENSSVPDHLLRGLGRSRADPGETGVLTGLIPVRWMLVLSTGLYFRSFRYRSKCLSRNGLQRRVGRARLNAPDSKSDIVARLSGVRIPHSPPLALSADIQEYPSASIKARYLLGVCFVSVLFPSADVSTCPAKVGFTWGGTSAGTLDFAVGVLFRKRIFGR